MKGHFIILLLVLFASCEQKSTVPEHKIFSEEKDTTIWYAHKLVINDDTIELDKSHHLYKYSDSIVTDWYFKNDTLRSKSDPIGGFLIWAKANDSIYFGVRAYILYFLDQPEKADPSYHQFNDNEAYIDHLLLKNEEGNPEKLENSIVIIKRLIVYERISNRILEQFSENPDTIFTW